MKKEVLVDVADLDRYIAKIDRIFSINDLINTEFDKSRITSYYKNSSFGYKYFHSKEGAVHMALNYDGVFDESGYFVQANEIAEVIKENEYTNVLELGCGKGFNSIYLAEKLTNTKFQGIDITDKHLAIANKSANGLQNLAFSRGDFHDIEFDNESFDLVFELEAVCHASDQEKVLKSVYDTLKQDGLFVLYEGFCKSNPANLSRNLQTAVKLTEKSMAVNGFVEIQNWLDLANKIGFKVKVCEDISEAIMPNLSRFQRMARIYYKYPVLSKAFLLVFPKELVMNSIAGLLMPFTIRNNALGYYRIILQK